MKYQEGIKKQGETKNKLKDFEKVPSFPRFLKNEKMI